MVCGHPLPFLARTRHLRSVAIREVLGTALTKQILGTSILHGEYVTGTMEMTFADGLLFLLPVATFLAICYYLFRFLYENGRR